MDNGRIMKELKELQEGVKNVSDQSPNTSRASVITNGRLSHSVPNNPPTHPIRRILLARE